MPLPPLNAEAPPPERVVEFPDTQNLNRYLIDLCGEFDRNLAQIEHQLAVQITRRGNILGIHGDAEAQIQAEAVLHALYQRVEAGRSIEPGDIDGIHSRVGEEDGTETNQRRVVESWRFAVHGKV